MKGLPLRCRFSGLVAFIALFVLVAPVLAVASDPESRVQEAETELLHANTYYWLGRERSNSAIEAVRSLSHVESAERIAQDLPPGPTKQNLLVRISENKAQIREQLAHQSESLGGQSPLLPTLLVEDEIVEFSDDAQEAAFERGLQALFEGTAGARIKVISEIMFILPLAEDRDPFIEELARRSLGDLTDYYVIGRHEAAAILDAEEFESLYADPIPASTLEALIEGLENRHMDVSGIGIVHLVENDQIGDVYYGGVYYRYWPAGGSDFKRYWYADGFAEQANGRTLLAGLLLLLALPLQRLLVWGTRRWDEQLGNHASPPPWWLALASAGFSALVLVLSMEGVRVLSPDLEAHVASMQSMLWYSGVGIGILFVPLIFTYLVAARIPTVAKGINNADAAASLLAGSMLGSLTVLGYFSWLRLGAPETFLLLGMIIPTLTILSFQLARAYSDHSIRESQEGLLQACAFLVGLAVYSVCILSWNIQTIAVGSCGILALLGLAVLIPQLVKWLQSWKSSEGDDEQPGQDENSLARLRREVAAPDFIASTKLDECLNKALSFVTESGMTDKLIEVVCVQSLEGGGKTRFARELGKRIAESFEDQEPGRTCTVLFGDCDNPDDPDSGAVPYEPFAQAMGALLGVRRFDDPTRNARALQSGLADKGLQTVMGAAGLGALGSLLDVSDDGENEIRKTTQAEMAQTIASALATLSKEGRIVFILDDVQWIDEDTKKLLENVFELLPSRFEDNEVSFVLTRRTETEDLLHELLGRLSESEKVLSVLDISLPTDDENRTDWINRLFEDLQFDYSSQEKIRRFAIERGYTLPLHVLQLISMLVDRGWIEQFGEGFRLTDGSDLENLKAPKDFNRLLEAQTEDLDPRLVDILHCCAVIGRRFRVSIVASIFELDLLELLSLLKTAEARQIVRDDADTDDLYEFCDKRTVSMFRNIVPTGGDRGSVMQAVREYRKRFVQQQSKILITKFGSIGEAPYAEISALASHAAAVKESLPREALDYCCIAAEMSQQRGLFGRAVEYFEHAISVFATAKDARIHRTDEVRIRLDYVRSLQDAQEKPDTVVKNLERLQELLSDCSKAELVSERIDLSLCMALRALRGRKFDDATEYSQSVTENAEATPAQKVRADFYAAASLSPHNPEERKNAHEKVVEDAESLLANPPDSETATLIEAVLSEACNNLGFILLNNLRDPEAARHSFEKAQEINLRPTLNDKKGLAISLGGLGDCAKMEEDREKARVFYGQNLEISRENGDLQGIGRMTSMLAELDLDEAKEAGSDRAPLLRSALKGYEQSLETSQKQKNPISCAFAHAGLLRVACAEGATGLIQHELERAASFVEGLSAPPLPGFALGALQGAIKEILANHGALESTIPPTLMDLTQSE